MDEEHDEKVVSDNMECEQEMQTLLKLARANKAHQQHLAKDEF